MARYVRGVLALVVGALLFSSLSLSVLVIVIATFGLARPFLVHGPMWMGKVMMVVIYRGILGMKVEVQGRPPRRHTGPVIAVANHPTMLLMMPLGAHFERFAGVPLVFVGKREHLWNPLIGWTLLVSGWGILIDRSKRRGALEKIRCSIARVLRWGCGLGILPDQSRPTPEFIADDQKKFAEKGVRDVADFRYTGVPRDGGVFACYDAMQDPRVIDVTCECSVPTARWGDVFDMVGATYFVIAEDVTHEVPQDTVGRREWLQNRWRLKNLLIGQMRGD